MDANNLSPSRFVVGIDLGTTNSALAFADTFSNETPVVQDLKILQLVQPAQVEALSVLPKPAVGGWSGGEGWGLDRGAAGLLHAQRGHLDPREPDPAVGRAPSELWRVGR